MVSTEADMKAWREFWEEMWSKDDMENGALVLQSLECLGLWFPNHAKGPQGATGNSEALHLVWTWEEHSSAPQVPNTMLEVVYSFSIALLVLSVMYLCQAEFLAVTVIQFRYHMKISVEW